MRHAFLALAAALLIACSAAPPPPSAGTPPANIPAATPTTPAAAAPVSTSPAAPAPVASAPAPASPVAVNPANPSRSCRSDADCAVKDVGNCCGYYPMCVNKDAVTDPAAVRAACASEGMAAVCGFREVRGCTCKAGVCEDASAAGPGDEVVR